MVYGLACWSTAEMETDSPTQVSSRAAAASTEVDRKLSHGPPTSCSLLIVSTDKRRSGSTGQLKKKKKGLKQDRVRSRHLLSPPPPPFSLPFHTLPRLLQQFPRSSETSLPFLLLPSPVNLLTISLSQSLCSPTLFSPDFCHCPRVCLWADPWPVGGEQEETERQHSSRQTALLTQRQTSLASFPFNIQV